MGLDILFLEIPCMLWKKVSNLQFGYFSYSLYYLQSHLADWPYTGRDTWCIHAWHVVNRSSIKNNIWTHSIELNIVIYYNNEISGRHSLNHSFRQHLLDLFLTISCLTYVVSSFAERQYAVFETVNNKSRSLLTIYLYKKSYSLAHCTHINTTANK
jgi:hypothetical protein